MFVTDVSALHCLGTSRSVGRDRSTSGEFSISFLEYQISMQVSSTTDHDKLMFQFWAAQVRPGPGPGPWAGTVQVVVSIASRSWLVLLNIKSA